MRIVALSLALVCVATAASADIVEWQDADGVRHYTNVKAEVPREHQQALQVVVDEVARRSPAPDAGTAPPETAAGSRPAEPRRQAEAACDRSVPPSAYVEGLERGLELGRTTNTGGSIQITGPLAVANSAAAIPYAAAPVPAYRSPLVTTSFDRGRSRHLTLRLLLQDQFAIDHEAPFVFEERFLPLVDYPPRGVALNPFLPRGLPHGFPRDLRVLVR